MIMKKYKEIVIIVMLIICALYGHCENNKYIYQFQDVDSMYLKIITQPIFVTSGITRLNFDIYWQESGRKGNVFKSKSEINNFLLKMNNAEYLRTIDYETNVDVQKLKIVNGLNFWENITGTNFDAQIIMWNKDNIDVIWIAQNEMFINKNIYRITHSLKQYLNHLKSPFFQSFRQINQPIIIGDNFKNNIIFKKGIPLDYVSRLIGIPISNKTYFFDGDSSNCSDASKCEKQYFYKDDKVLAWGYIKITEDTFGYIYEVFSDGVGVDNDLKRIYLSIFDAEDNIIQTKLIGLYDKDKYLIQSTINDDILEITSSIDNTQKRYKITSKGLVLK